mmetsp:Transcript_10905/g.36998  ORF Transcript_10905/g.36998 Transcript_10905/m.36998 type:complete len:226 (+) Transcript_10905:403-1080(+)
MAARQAPVRGGPARRDTPAPRRVLPPRVPRGRAHPAPALRRGSRAAPRGGRVAPAGADAPRPPRGARPGPRVPHPGPHHHPNHAGHAGPPRRGRHRRPARVRVPAARGGARQGRRRQARACRPRHGHALRVSAPRRCPLRTGHAGAALQPGAARAAFAHGRGDNGGGGRARGGGPRGSARARCGPGNVGCNARAARDGVPELEDVETAHQDGVDQRAARGYGAVE